MTFIKFCGMTREDDVLTACALGVNAIGFIMWPNSPRFVETTRVASLVRCADAAVIPVGVLVRPTRDELRAARDAGVRAVQIHGIAGDSAALASVDSSADVDVWIATSFEDQLDSLPRGRRVLLDAHDPVRHGGTGRTIDWHRSVAAAQGYELMLAGGLTPQNVALAIRTVRPFGVDVASGIEDRPGQKDPRAMTAFVAAVREADQG
jgi:phosphoribosylanthranilate isomerase